MIIQKNLCFDARVKINLIQGRTSVKTISVVSLKIAVKIQIDQKYFETFKNHKSYLSKTLPNVTLGKN